MLGNTYLFLGHYIILCVQCVLANGNPMIGQNVEKVKTNEFPFVVSLMRNSTADITAERNHICTGALISPRDVLTAEHCLKGEKRTDILVLVDSIDLRSGRKHQINWWITYKTWAKQRHMSLEYSENDIAIIRLNEAVTHRITPATVSTLSNSDFVGYDVVVTGWGQSNDGFNPRYMEKIDVKVLSKTNCENKIQMASGKLVPLDSRFICTSVTPFGLLQPVRT
ncbi:PREDICTED: trypsin delta/gamma-like [Ceratosolen solmsi marchali]|uniref:Trypsin delta/gamma-like n=1 Tax=Ceratosolen solmsi marchali TaxID=326594 RepID=A0AAJ6YCM9_9HYME|nr:PREDICTED: trypsin delta/gamma-like [Ceratosolen solmsi marchali]